MSLPTPKKPSKAALLLDKAGLTMPVPLLMFKAAIGPTIALAIYQSNAVAQEYNILGYLVAIAAVLGFAMFPRAKFIQTMILNTLTVCVATAVTLLSTWSAVQARKHTTPLGGRLAGYNSSASAVCAVWLFFQVLMVNAVRSKLPQMIFPVIIYTIFANIALTNGAQFATTAAAINFAKTLMKSFLTGFAIATGVHFVIFPANARKPVWGEIHGTLGAMRGVCKAQLDYMAAFGDKPKPKELGDAELSNGEKHTVPKPATTELATREKALGGAAQYLLGLLGKLQGDVVFAKREFAYGKLGASDIREIMKLLQSCALPFLGLASLSDITHRAARRGGWEDVLTPDTAKPLVESDDETSAQRHAFEEWQKTFKAMHGPFSLMVEAINDAMTHVALQLELEPRPKISKTGSETPHNGRQGDRDSSKPGETDFATSFEHTITRFYDSRRMTLHGWCAQHGIQLPANSFEAKEAHDTLFDSTTDTGRSRRYQIYVILYQEYLLYAAGKAMLQMVRYADGKVADGTMSKKRLILPGGHRLQKWLYSIFLEPQTGDSNEQAAIGMQEQPVSLSYGQGYATHDPEHLPPSSTLQRLGNVFRVVPHALRSEHSAHGFRAACATMSVAVICYLRDTQAWFIEQRLVWASIMIAFSMQRTSGQALFHFSMRIGGTLLATVGSYVVWYIVNGHTAGVIVFEFLWLASCFWLLLSKPRYAILAILTAITSILIIGYELQVKKIGVRVSESNGQPAYPLYSLAPYRLATVVGGLSVAYFWTIFPYPISEHAELRRDVSSTMSVLARYYSIVHETVQLRSQNREGDISSPTSPASILDKTRHKTFAQMQILLTQLREVNSYSHWQLDLGGRFPHETYTAITDALERITRCTSLIGYASTSFRVTHRDAEDSNAEWLQNFTSLVASLDPTSHAIATRLCVLSASLSAGTPLPPYMPEFEAFHLAKRIHALDKDILSVKHIAEPGYAAFAVLQIASRALVDELNDLTRLTKELVGEMDFRVAVAGA